MGSDSSDAVSQAIKRASSPPYKLWRQAEAEHPDDEMARRLRYHDLMVEHGHIVKAEPGQDRNLPCGWPGRAGEPE